MAMTKEDAVPSPAVDPAREFLEFWRNYFEQTAIQTTDPPGEHAGRQVPGADAQPVARGR